MTEWCVSKYMMRCASKICSWVPWISRWCCHYNGMANFLLNKFDKFDHIMNISFEMPTFLMSLWTSWFLSWFCHDVVTVLMSCLKKPLPFRWVFLWSFWPLWWVCSWKSHDCQQEFWTGWRAWYRNSHHSDEKFEHYGVCVFIKT